MPRPTTTEPTDVELEMLEDLWEHGPSTLGKCTSGWRPDEVRGIQRLSGCSMS